MSAIKAGNVVEVRATSFGLGSSGTANKKRAYTTSPLYDGSYSLDAQVKLAFLQPPELVGTTINDGGYAFGLVDRFYSGSPNLADVVVGGAGLPGSPYAPNLGVPGEGNGVNYAAIPASGVETTEAARPRGPLPFVGDGLVSPSQTRAAIVDPAQRGLGIGSGNSYRIRLG